MKIFFGKEEFEANDISLGKIPLNGMSLGDIDLSEIIAPPPEMILNITTPSANFALNLFDYVGGSEIDDAIIDWGDDSDTITINPSTSTLSHTYKTISNYQLKIKGSIKWKGLNQSLATSSLSQCLTSIELPTNNSPIVDIGTQGFRYFTKLVTIPAGLFDNCIKVTSFSYCFYYCNALQNIPEGLFNNNTAVTYFTYCFGNCSSLQAIPEGLFDNNTAVTTFSNCFQDCTSLQAIPEHLFDNNTKVTNFYYCFTRCSSLQAIPEGLFDKCTKVTIFNWCFYDCKSVTSNLPTLWISHPNASHSVCFNNCDKAPNYPEAYAAGWATSPAVSLTLNTLQDNQLIDLSPYIKPIENTSKIEIEWGDNNIESTSIDNVQHTYANKGEYVVDIYGDVEWVEPRARAIQAGWNISNIVKS